MVRSIPPERFGQLVDAATQVFLARGYRSTQMADVAEALRVAKGTLYGYVESKEALFDAAVRFADGHLPAPSVEQLPLRTPAPGQTLDYVRGRIATEAASLVLLRVVTGSERVEDAAEEIRLVLSDLYRCITRNRLALKLLDRCALDYPDLAAIWFGQGRGAQLELLTEWIRSRTRQGSFLELEHPELVARTALEAIAFWALHRHFGGKPERLDDAAAERALIEFLSRGLLGSRP